METLILPDGSTIASGVTGETAIVSVRWTQHRNPGSKLTLGAVCCKTLELELFSPVKPAISRGDRLVYQEDGMTRGVFYCNDLSRISQSRWQLTARDGMTRFQRELGDFWENRSEDTVLSLLLALCQHCGVTTKLKTLPGGDLPVPVIPEYTGWQLLQLMGQAAGRFFYMDRNENLCAGWYDDVETVNNYLSLTCDEDYTDPVQQVLLRQDKNDVGAVYPEGEIGPNTLVIQGNPILQGDRQDVAMRLQKQLAYFSLKPFSCTLLPGREAAPGCYVDFLDLDGVRHMGAIMQWEKKDGICTIRGIGGKKTDDPDLTAVQAQLLGILRTAKGIALSQQDLQGNVAKVQLALSGVDSRVTKVEDSGDTLTTEVSRLSQTSDKLQLSLTQVTQELGDRQELSKVTEHFIFDAAGLTIQNSATGMGILVSENQVAFTGGEKSTTLIRPDNMETARLTVGKRLDLGGFSFIPRTDGNLSFRYTGAG